MSRPGPRRWRRYTSALGPGLVTGVSDDDPSGIATYASAGATAGYGLLWTAVYSAPLLAAVQEIADRTALTTGQGLGELMAGRLPVRLKWIATVLLCGLIAANSLNIAADLAAIGSGVSLLGAGPSPIWALLAGVAIWFMLMVGNFDLIASVFKLLALSLAAYLVVAIVVHPSLGVLAVHSFLPAMTLSGTNVRLLVAILGTTISPYMIFWQSAHRIEELREESPRGEEPPTLDSRSARASALKERTSRVDVFAGAALSTVVMWAIMVATAATVGVHKTAISTAAQAASALAPVAGRGASLVFSLGFIASGVLAVPILAGSGAAGLSGILDRDWGFSRSPSRAPVFYSLVALGTLGGTALTLLGVNVIQLLVVVALINGLVATPFVVALMMVSSDGSVMHEHRNHLAASLLGWATALIMCAGGLYVLITLA
jgi:NRAMP (natural resistance-associated macrophage protein)-like metal ion transporter